MADNYEIDVTLEETFGTGVRSVEQTVASTESGGQNEITVTLTNDQQNKFYVMNGLKGADGKDGGYPVAVSTMSEMTDTSVVYLYERETYSWNGIAWVSNGTYGAPATYITKASETEEIILDQQGNHVATVNGIALDGLQGGNPIQSSFETKLYAVTGENEDGALTQKATSEAIDAAQFLPVVNYPGSDTSVVSGVNLMVDLKPNKLYKVSGIGTAYTYVAVTLTGNKLNALNRFYMQFTTGGTAVRIVFPSNVVVPSAFSIKTQTRYDIIIEDRVAKIWEDGNAVGDVLDATATAGAVAAWLDGHPEATTTVADGSITTAKLASGVIDANLRTSGAAADAKAVGDELTELKSEIALNSGIPRAVKIALDNILQNVAFKNDTDYSADKSAIHAWATEIKALSISAVYAGTKPIYSFYDIESLRDDLVVTATYDNGTTAEVTTYTLSGSLTEGTSAITVSYEGLTTTFNVTVTGKEFTYTASDGVLTEQPYFDYTQDERMTVNATSDSTNGTHIVVPKVSGSFWAKCLQSAFDFTESAHLTAEFKIINTGYYASGNTTSPGVLMFYASDGEKGSMVGFARDNSATGAMKIRTSVGATVTKGATVSLNEWHTLDIVIANGKQTVTLDNTAVITNADLTTGKSGYSANTCIGFSTNQTADTDFYIRNVQYSAV